VTNSLTSVFILLNYCSIRCFYRHQIHDRTSAIPLHEDPFPALVSTFAGNAYYGASVINTSTAIVLETVVAKLLSAPSSDKMAAIDNITPAISDKCRPATDAVTTLAKAGVTATPDGRAETVCYSSLLS
jgi:hypothetical protein